LRRLCPRNVEVINIEQEPGDLFPAPDSRRSATG
jgi:hypothetical protein